ncbi:MAG: hypothetical protein AAFX09_00685 [Pseudomonadota bacterium]
MKVELTDLAAITEGRRTSFSRVDDTTTITNGIAGEDAVWLRKPVYAPMVEPSVSTPSIYELANTEETLLLALQGIESTVCARSRCLNPPDRAQRAANKIFQLWAAKACGFSVPKTLVTNDFREAKAFCDSMLKSIYKPLRHSLWPISANQYTMLRTTSVCAQGFAELDENAAWAPGILQERIEKAAEYRVVVIADSVLAYEIRHSHGADQVDWRQNPPEENLLEFSACVLPPETLGALGRLKSLLALEHFVVDLAKSVSGEIFFLEVNPHGQFLFPEAANDELPVLYDFSAALFQWLAGERYPVSAAEVTLETFFENSSFKGQPATHQQPGSAGLSRKTVSVFDPIAVIRPGELA